MLRQDACVEVAIPHVTWRGRWGASIPVALQEQCCLYVVLHAQAEPGVEGNNL